MSTEITCGHMVVEEVWLHCAPAAHRAIWHGKCAGGVLSRSRAFRCSRARAQHGMDAAPARFPLSGHSMSRRAPWSHPTPKNQGATLHRLDRKCPIVPGEAGSAAKVDPYAQAKSMNLPGGGRRTRAAAGVAWRRPARGADACSQHDPSRGPCPGSPRSPTAARPVLPGRTQSV